MVGAAVAGVGAQLHVRLDPLRLGVGVKRGVGGVRRVRQPGDVARVQRRVDVRRRELRLAAEGAEEAEGLGVGGGGSRE